MHCWGGVGRTGTVVGCWLVRHGLDGGDADRAHRRAARDIPGGRPSPETPGQAALVRGWRRGPVKRLWLLRHAKSSWDEPGLADHDRPLAPRGRKAGKRIRRWAAEHGVRPDLVLCSTAVRARATLELVAPALGSPEVEIEGGLYHASADDLLERLRDAARRRRVRAVIGHNPGLHDLAALLAPPGPDAFPTGALAELQIDVEELARPRPGGAELVELVLPRSLAD